VTAAEAAHILGGASRSGAWWRCRCPVHNSHGPTLAVREGDRGLILHCHAGCDPRKVLAELRRRGLIDGRSDGGLAMVATRSSDRADGVQRIALARRIWRAARDARGSPVARYLGGRGITMPPPRSLRYVPALRRPDGTYAPAMVARVDGPDGVLIGVHRTWLARDAAGIWRRRDRAMLGCAAGGAVRLAPAAEVLLIGEGIETVLATMQATAMPGWAAMSTSGLMALVLPAVVGNVIILADNDLSGAGERAAIAAAARWLPEGRRVRIAMPPASGTDFADVLASGAAVPITEPRNVAA
jgi:putative DNA primase/helicase